MYPLNYLFNYFLPKRPMPKLSLLQVTLYINVNINFLSIDTRRYLYSLCWVNPHFTMCLVQTLELELEAFIIKASTNLTSLKCHSNTLQGNRITNCWPILPPPKLFHLVSISRNSLLSTYRNSILPFRDISSVTWEQRSFYFLKP